MEEKGKKKLLFFIILGIAILIVIGLIVYFLFFNKAVSSFFGTPDFSSSASLGDIFGNIFGGNVWENVKLNPFSNSS